MDTDELDYLEKRGLDLPPLRISTDLTQQQPRQYHSQLSGDGVCGLSAYGLILLAFLTFASLVLFGLVRGFWHLCVRYAAVDLNSHARYRQNAYH